MIVKIMSDEAVEIFDTVKSANFNRAASTLSVSINEEWEFTVKITGSAIVYARTGKLIANFEADR